MIEIAFFDREEFVVTSLRKQDVISLNLHHTHRHIIQRNHLEQFVGSNICDQNVHSQKRKFEGVFKNNVLNTKQNEEKKLIEVRKIQ
jgi:hypothetical protein